MKKTLAMLLVLPMVASFSLFPANAGGQTISELQAQINNLLAIISQLQAQLATLSDTTPSQGFVFTNDMTLGSTGPQVSQLQMFLVSRGFLVMPAGVPFGYFGPLTRAALAQFQASRSISPAVGYFGPITRTAINTMLANQGGGTTTPPNGGITTPGVEGIMTVTSYNAGLRSSVYEGENMVPVLGARISARLSDIAVQRVKVDLGDTTTLYNKILSRLYVTDGNNVLASADLNSSTVVREGDRRFVTITGFNYVVPEGEERNLVIKADIRNSIDSSDEGIAHTIRLANNGIRGVDGAGIDHYSPSIGSSISRNITAQESLIESARLALSLSSESPRTQEIIASSGAGENEKDKATILVFNVRAERDNVLITDMTVNVEKAGSGGATASSTVYLYEGSTEIDNASVSGGSAVFQNLDYTVPKDATRTLSLRVDIRNANSGLAYISLIVLSSGIVAENSIGDQLSSSNITGSAASYQIGFRNVGPELALISKSTNSNGVPQASDETSIMTATFSLRIRAVGGDIVMGLPASSTPAIDTGSFVIYRNGSADSIGASAKAISYTVPTGANTAGLTDSFRISEGSEVTLPVTFQLLGREGGSPLASGLYSIGLDNINWVAGGSSQTINFMSGLVEWRTSDVSFP